MSITNKLLAFFAFLLLFIGVLLVDLWLMHNCSHLLAEAHKNRFDTHKIAEQLRRSSDDLTRMARSYVITGNNEFKKYFGLIADIRDGRESRPQGYHRIFWDYVTADFDISKYHDAPGRKVSIVTLMKELHFTDEELSLLAQAKKDSDRLMIVERKAFEIRERGGRRAAVSGTDNGASAIEPAVRLLFGKSYHTEKAQIMRKIDAVFKKIETRTNNEVLKQQSRQQLYQVTAIFLTVLIVIYILLSLVYFRKQFIKPIKSLEGMVQQAEIGEYTDVEPRSMDEIGALIRAFNHMNKVMRTNIDELNRMSLTDELTRLHNRRALLNALQSEKNRFDRYHIICSIIIADIDHFKRINDRYGHHIGDRVLVEMSSIFVSRLRTTDVCGRWGGEEFLFVFPNTEYDAAKKIGESLRNDVSQHLFPKVGHVTASFGVSAFRENEDMDHAVKRADDALYEAKESGRNRVC